MLRLTVLLLLLANAVYFVWAQGLLLPIGFGPSQQSEPQRLGQQLRPEAIRILSATEAARTEAPAPAAPVFVAVQPECLESEPLEESGTQPLRQALQAWPAGSWTLDAAVEPSRWIVYMGKYLTVENVNRKKAELRQIGVSFEPLTNPELELGLSLGGFASRTAANQYLERLTERGVRTAQVVQERPEVRGRVLKLPQLDDALRARLEELQPALGGRPLRPCR